MNQPLFRICSVILYQFYFALLLSTTYCTHTAHYCCGVCCLRLDVVHARRQSIKCFYCYYSTTLPILSKLCLILWKCEGENWTWLLTPNIWIILFTVGLFCFSKTELGKNILKSKFIQTFYPFANLWICTANCLFISTTNYKQLF